jgi:gas vesicle protein
LVIGYGKKWEDVMAQGDTTSLQEIRRETERTRAGLTGTVDDLRSTIAETATEIRDRLRPDAIKAEVSGYIRSRGEEFLHNITESARRNPMQAVAVGASVAYPLMRLARAIPLPILMIGAGLFFAGSKTGRDLTQKASDMAEDVTDEARRHVHDVADQASQAASGAKDYATDAVSRARDAVGGGVEQLRNAGMNAATAVQEEVARKARSLRDSAGTTGVSISGQAGQLGERANDIGQSARASVQGMVSDVTEAVSEATVSRVRASRDVLATTRQHATDARQTATRTMRQTIEQNPLLVAGAGLLLGGLIASALPKLAMEENLIGDASKEARKRAQEAAARGFEAAKGAADEILTNVARKADAEGLTPDGMARGVQDVGQRLQRVAERGITTAFQPEQSQEHPLQDTVGGKEHG